MADIKGTISVDGSGVSAGLNQATSLVNAATKRIAGAFGAGMAINFVKDALQATNALNDMSEETGISVRQLQVLRNEAANTGSSFDSVRGAVQRIVRELGSAKDGAEASVDKFRKLGISFQALQDMDTDQAVKAVGAALRDAEPGSVAFSAGIDLIGKTGPAATQALVAFAESIGNVRKEIASGPIISDEQMGMLKAYADGWEVTKTKVGAFAVEMIMTLDKLRPGMQGMSTDAIQFAEDLKQFVATVPQPKPPIKLYTDAQEKELATLEKTAQASYEKTVALQEEEDIKNGILTLEMKLAQAEQERLDIAKELNGLGDKTDFDSAKRRLILQEQQDKAVEASFKIKADITKRDEANEKAYAATRDSLNENNRKVVEDQRRYEEEADKRRIDRVKAIKDAQEGATVTVIASDRIRQIGGSVGGQISPALTIAQRQLVVQERMAKALEALPKTPINPVWAGE